MQVIRPARKLSCWADKSDVLLPCVQLADLARAEQYMSRLSRVAAAISLRTSDPLTEGAHDPITELRHYYASMASSNVTLSWQVGVRRDSHFTTVGSSLSLLEAIVTVVMIAMLVGSMTCI